MRYCEHVSQFTRERTAALLVEIKERVTFFGMAVLVLIPVTLLANGVGLLVEQDNLPLIVSTGCQIGLNQWYIFLTGLVCLKLFLECLRFLTVR